MTVRLVPMSGAAALETAGSYPGIDRHLGSAGFTKPASPEDFPVATKESVLAPEEDIRDHVWGEDLAARATLVILLSFETVSTAVGAAMVLAFTGVGMKIAVFGATGKTGKLHVAQALDGGGSVTVPAGKPAGLGIANDRLTEVGGELTDIAAVVKVVAGTEAVVSLLGRLPVNGTPIAHGARNIHADMQTFGVRRIVAVTTSSAVELKGVPPLQSRVAVAFVRLFVHAAYEDVIPTVNAIRDSRVGPGLDNYPSAVGQ